VYLPKYVPAGSVEFLLTDQELEESFVGALLKMYPHLERSDVLAFRVSRVPFVLAISTVGYSSNLPPMETSVPGVFIVNSAHILNGTLNVNECIQLARKTMKDSLK
jgi:protoporphyrinogen oxidase